MREIIFYKTTSGDSPIEEFLESLDSKQVQKVIWEIRVQQSNNIFRLLGFQEEDRLVVLTNGFTKKAQKTPKNEIVLAEKRKKEYLERK